MRRPIREDTKLLTHALPELRVKRFRIEVVDGLDVGATAESDGEDFPIGTADGNRLVLRDHSVSRHHCLIETQGRGFCIRDLDSTNGTMVDGMRVECAYLNNGATIRVGVTQLKFWILKDTVKRELSTEHSFGEVVGSSIAMRRLFAVLRRVAQSNATLLLQGETGTGKTAIAQAVHRNSARADGPFVVVDCASIPPTLMESELFGHERGSFTGADALRIGAIERAHTGTLFLDEIGELPLDMQPKLLRAIDDRTIQRVGGVGPRRVDLRVIAATNRELRQEVNRGAFRSDLYYRLNTVKVVVPPLRSRREDIPMLVRHFAAALGVGDDQAGIVERIADAWQRRDWPGNVRELRSAVERAIVLGADHPADGVLPLLSSLPPPPSSTPLPSEAILTGGGRPLAARDFSRPFREAKAEAVAAWEKAYLAALLREHEGNLSRAARAVEMDRNYLRDLARRHGLVE